MVKKFTFKPTNHRLYLIARALGHYPYSYNIRSIRRWFWYSLFINLIFIFISTYAHMVFIAGSPSAFFIKSFSWITLLKLSLSSICCLFNIVKLRKNSKEFVTLLRHFRSFPYQNLPNRKFVFETIFTLSVLRYAVIITSMAVTSNSYNLADTILEISSVFFDFGSFLTLLIFSSLTEVLGSFLSVLANKVRINPNHIGSTFDRHLDFKEATDQLSDLFGWQLLFGCFIKSFNMVSYIFLCINIVQLNSWDGEQIRILVFYLERALWEFINLTFLAGFCSNIKSRFGLLAPEVIKLANSNKLLYADPKINLYLLRKEDCEISASGFFPIGYHLLVTVATTSCTYLVVLQSFT